MSKQTKSLAKNTIFLYLRMIVVLTVSLFTTRIILRNLGVEDYGIYNVVGSIVSLFSFLQTAMSSANYRYLAFAIGKEDRVELLAVFKSAFIISLFIALVILLIGEKAISRAIDIFNNDSKKDKYAKNLICSCAITSL